MSCGGGLGIRMDACCMEAEYISINACDDLGSCSLVLGPFGFSDACLDLQCTCSSQLHEPQVV